jgi:hypothetical protein
VEIKQKRSIFVLVVEFLFATIATILVATLPATTIVLKITFIAGLVM